MVGHQLDDIHETWGTHDQMSIHSLKKLPGNSFRPFWDAVWKRDPLERLNIGDPPQNQGIKNSVKSCESPWWLFFFFSQVFSSWLVGVFSLEHHAFTPTKMINGETRNSQPTKKWWFQPRTSRFLFWVELTNQPHPPIGGGKRWTWPLPYPSALECPGGRWKRWGGWSQ